MRFVNNRKKIQIFSLLSVKQDLLLVHFRLVKFFYKEVKTFIACSYNLKEKEVLHLLQVVTNKIIKNLKQTSLFLSYKNKTQS